jgi:long-subunit acyl-CoA synthetase (AMP-forming)
MKEFGTLSSGVKVKFKTTGSTGKPKEVLHSEESLQHSINSNIEVFGLNKSDILLDFIPRYTIGSYIMARPMEQIGGTIYSDKFSPEVFKQMINLKPTKLILIPTMVRMLKESGLRPNCSSIEHMLIGAEETSVDDVEFMLELGVQKVMHGYGSTECIPVVMGTNFVKGDDIHLGIKLIGGWDIMLDKTLRLRGESMLSNYDKDFFDTKDIFTFDGEFFYWKGRSDNIVKRSGWKTVKKN